MMNLQKLILLHLSMALSHLCVIISILCLNTSFSCKLHIYKYKQENKGLDMYLLLELLDIYNSQYHFEVNSMKNYAVSVFIVA